MGGLTGDTKYQKQICVSQDRVTGEGGGGGGGGGGVWVFLVVIPGWQGPSGLLPLALQGAAGQSLDTSSGVLCHLLPPELGGVSQKTKTALCVLPPQCLQGPLSVTTPGPQVALQLLLPSHAH